MLHFEDNEDFDQNARMRRLIRWALILEGTFYHAEAPL